jgi:hypothetical protein
MPGYDEYLYRIGRGARSSRFDGRDRSFCVFQCIRGMIGEDFEPCVSEDGFTLLEAVDDSEHLLIVHRVVAFTLIKGLRMETGGTHSFIVFALTVVTSNHVVTAISH